MHFDLGKTYFENDVGFHLSLADGKKWVLTGHPHILPWLNQLAAIMQLEKGCVDGWPRIHFYPRAGAPGPFPESHWTGWDYKSLRLWFHDTTAEVLCEVDNREGQL